MPYMLSSLLPMSVELVAETLLPLQPDKGGPSMSKKEL